MYPNPSAGPVHVSPLRRLALLWVFLLALGVLAPASAAEAAAGASARPLDALLGRGQAAASPGDDFLPVDKAFRFDASSGADAVRLYWEIADGYYLYRSRLRITSEGRPDDIGEPELPGGQFKNDEYFGRQEIYHRELAVRVPVKLPAGAPVTLRVSYQGCAEAGLCYPPVTRSIHLLLGSAANGSGATAPGGSSAATTAPPAGAGFVAEQDRFAGLIRSGSFASMLGWFYLAGLLLAFTPCVLPMVPILSGIIAGHGRNVTAMRGFLLSLSYVLGMAFTYTIAGAVCAAAGKQVQAMFQQTWILVLFAGVFIALALSMLGLFTVQMPVSVQTRVASLSNRQSAGTFGGVAVMGALSALIVTTCVGPALVGALIVISQTGQAARGAAALFAMSLGMGTPLLLVGASAGKLLPKAGPWMETVKKLFGVMMLAVAAWMLARVVPARAILLLWAVPAGMACALLLRAARGAAPLAWGARLAGAAAGLYALALVGGSVLGGRDPLAPLPRLGAPARELAFRSIKSVDDLQRAVAEAQAGGRSVLLDFYADWCTSCKEMEKYTFSDPRVQGALAGTVLLRADVTRNDDTDQALLKHFGIFGPPTIAFYDRTGHERASYRVVGYMRADAFADRVRAALGPDAALGPAAASAPGTTAGASTS